MEASGDHSESLKSALSSTASPDPAGTRIPRLGESRKTLSRNNTKNALFELAALVESCDDAIIGQTLDGLIASWNAGAERVYGYSADEVMGRPISLLMPDDRKNEMDEILDKVKRGERVDHIETIRVRNDGKKISISLTVSPIKNASGRIVAASGVGRDITERYELERQKDAFLSLASHELRTPLATITGFVYLAKRLAIETGNDRLISYLHSISSHVGLLSRLVNDLLNVSHIESGLLPLHTERFDLRELIQEVIESAELINPRFTFAFEDPLLPAVVDADRQLIQEVLANLVDNAIKYSADRHKVEIKVAVVDSEIVTSVHDFGIGIPAGQQDRVFDRFYRATTSVVRANRGLGLGLYISRSIVERHGGRIWLESAPEAGSTFYFALPQNQGS